MLFFLLLFFDTYFSGGGEGGLEELKKTLSIKKNTKLIFRNV